MAKAIVTGASGDMGKVIALELAKKGYDVVMACRNIGKATPIRDEIIAKSGNSNIDIKMLDLCSLTSVKNFAQEVIKEGDIAILINNAGILCHEYQITKDGFEMNIGVNYLAPILLCQLLLPNMNKGGRIVNVVSCTTQIGKINEDIFHPQSSFQRFPFYSNSKLALLLGTIELSSKAKELGITINAADPGIVSTGMITMGKWFDPIADVIFRPFIRTPEEGAATALHVALTDDGIMKNGALFASSKEKSIPERILRCKNREWLKDETQKILDRY